MRENREKHFNEKISLEKLTFKNKTDTFKKNIILIKFIFMHKHSKMENDKELNDFEKRLTHS